MSAIGDPQLLKLINQGVVYRMLRAKPGMSRSQLSQFTGLTKSTISILVKELIEERWLVESEVFSKNSMGRPSTSIFVDAHSRSLIGVDIAREFIRIVSVSTSGEVHISFSVEHSYSDLDSVLTLVSSLILEVNDSIQSTGQLTGGMGISFAGVYDENSGKLRSSPDFSWRNEPIAEKLRISLKRRGLSDIPVFIHSKKHCYAVGSHEFSDQREDTLMYLDFSHSIQIGLIMGDKICAGFSGTAGDIGHTYIQEGESSCEVCGRCGCVNSLLAFNAIEKLPDAAVRVSTVAALFHNLWQTFNPSVFVMGGVSLGKWPMLFEAAKQRFVHEHSSETDAPVFKVCQYGDLAAAVGAAALPHYYRLRPLESPSNAISRALDLTGQRLAKGIAHGHVSWN